MLVFICLFYRHRTVNYTVRVLPSIMSSRLSKSWEQVLLSFSAVPFARLLRGPRRRLQRHQLTPTTFIRASSPLKSRIAPYKADISGKSKTLTACNAVVVLIRRSVVNLLFLFMSLLCENKDFSEKVPNEFEISTVPFLCFLKFSLV